MEFSLLDNLLSFVVGCTVPRTNGFVEVQHGNYRVSVCWQTGEQQ